LETAFTIDPSGLAHKAESNNSTPRSLFATQTLQLAKFIRLTHLIVTASFCAALEIQLDSVWVFLH
jgi:hypothetical protein